MEKQVYIRESRIIKSLFGAILTNNQRTSIYNVTLMTTLRRRERLNEPRRRLARHNERKAHNRAVGEYRRATETGNECILGELFAGILTLGTIAAITMDA